MTTTATMAASQDNSTTTTTITEGMRRQFHRDGFLVVPNGTFKRILIRTHLEQNQQRVNLINVVSTYLH